MTAINQHDTSLHTFFSNLQGNILKGHGRNHTTHIFLHFDTRREKKVKEWLADFSENYVTSFAKQLKERENFKRNKVGGGMFASIFLTKSGYEYLGFNDVSSKLQDEAFDAGMKSRVGLQDPPSTKWEKGFQQDIHVMILLADNDANRMGGIAKKLLIELDNFSKISVEYGNAIRNANGDGLEHFGYVDGISQPLFLKDEIDEYKNSISPLNMNFDPQADTSLVLVSDPYSQNGASFGSFFVFRKLEQNVQEFKKEEKNLGFGELGGAQIVGRFEDGTPVVVSDTNGLLDSGKFNNFDYSSDPSGGRCPHFAHIRKTNPRENADQQNRRMARRGIPFGHREVSTEVDPDILQMPTEGIGLLFMSYQKSIPQQFEFIQNSWANNENFPQTNTGIDAIIGQSAGGVNRLYDFPENYGSPAPSIEKGFRQFVTMKGGEYFFAPSMNFLLRGLK